MQKTKKRLDWLIGQDVAIFPEYDNGIRVMWRQPFENWQDLSNVFSRYRSARTTQFSYVMRSQNQRWPWMWTSSRTHHINLW
jgi:hypothetical protein